MTWFSSITDYLWPTTPPSEDSAERDNATQQKLEDEFQHSVVSDTEKKEKLIKEVEAESSTFGTGLDKIAATAKVIFLNPKNRRDFFEDATKGIIRGTFPPSQPKEGADAPESDVSFIESIFSGLRHLGGEAFGQVTAIALRKLLSHAKAPEWDEEGKKLLEEAKNTLNKAKTSDLYTKAQEIREKLSKYHVIVGGFDISLLLRWIEDHPDEKVKSLNPISSFIECQEKIGALKTLYKLPESSIPIALEEVPPPQVSDPVEEEKKKKAIEDTDASLNHFCTQVAHISTMKAVDGFFDIHRQETVYNRIIKDAKVRQAYANQCFKGIKKYLVQIPFVIVQKLITPIISKMLFQFLSDIRNFLQNDIDLLKFSESKISDLSDYMGAIETQRVHYLDKGTRTDLVGTFEGFCKLKLIQYGEKFTEEELLSTFKDYIVDRYTPRPTPSIPLLSSLVFSIRKRIIRHYLKKTQIIETYLKEGTSSIQVAQYGFKQLLVKKLNELKKLIHKNSAKNSSVEKKSDLLSPEDKKAKAQKDKILRDFPDKIDEFSGKLVHFIDIEACNGDDKKLKELDNRVATLFQELKKVLHPILPLETFSLSDTLRSATSDLTIDAISSLFRTNGDQIEKQLQETIQLLGRSFAYASEEERRLADVKMQQEMISLDQQIKTLLEELSSTAVKQAINQKLQNVSGERHQRVVDFVEKGKVKAQEWVRTFHEKKDLLETQLKNKSDLKGENRFNAFQKDLGEVVDSVDHYLRHLCGTLCSKELQEECYSDVQKELFSTYQQMSIILSIDIIPALETLAKQNKQIKESDEIDELSPQFLNLSKAISSEQSEEEHKKTIEDLNKLYNEFSPLIGDDSKNLKDFIEILNTAPAETSRLTTKIELKTQLNEKIALQETINRGFTQSNKITTELKTISTLINEFSSIQKNRVYPTTEAVNLRKKTVFNLINHHIEQLKSLQEIDDRLHQTVLKPILDISLPILVENENPPIEGMNKAVQQLEKLLLSNFFRSRQTLFHALAQVNVSFQQQSFTLKKEITSLKKNLGEDSEKKIEELRASLKSKTNYLEATKNQILSFFEALQKQQIIKRERAQKSIYDQFHTMGTKIKESYDILQEPRVKGYISVGESQLQETLSPKILAVVAPQVHEKMQTIVKSLQKTLHWKQLVLRLILTDVANRGQELGK